MLSFAYKLSTQYKCITCNIQYDNMILAIKSTCIKCYRNNLGSNIEKHTFSFLSKLDALHILYNKLCELKCYRKKHTVEGQHTGTGPKSNCGDQHKTQSCDRLDWIKSIFPIL